VFQHQLSQRPNQSISTVGGAIANVSRGREVTHLVLEVGEIADMVDLALLVQSTDRLSPDRLAPTCDNLFESGLFICCGHGEPHHVATIVALCHDAIRTPPVVQVNSPPAPALRRHLAGAVLQDVSLAIHALACDDDADIVTAADMEVDFLALSFPRDAEDVEEARHRYRQAGGQGGIVAKIERAEAVADDATLDAIILASDGVMVARGDLAVEIGDAELVGVQKHIIRRARALNRFVITATQMMESMIHSPQPTRAEVSDVANAVLDGTDAVMLSAETAVGEYPVETVQAMDRIILGAERTWQERRTDRPINDNTDNIDEVIAMAAMQAANRLSKVTAIIAMTESGNTPRLMSRLRSGIPIYAFTPYPSSQRRVAILRGVRAIPFDSHAIASDEVNRRAVVILEEMGVVQEGDRVLITKGNYNDAHGGTNTLKVIQVGGNIQ